MAMASLVHSANCQEAGFIVTTIGWIFSMICMSLAKCCVWYMESSSTPSTALACVGMWKVCSSKSCNLQCRAIACHRYTYSDTYLPLNICITQHLLLAANLLALLGKVFTIMSLQRVCVAHLQKKNTCNFFLAARALSVIAGVYVFIVVLWNYHAVMNEEGINFPPSFHIPFRPSWHEIGSTVPGAVLAAILMLLSGLFTLFYQLHPPPLAAKCAPRSHK